MLKTVLKHTLRENLPNDQTTYKENISLHHNVWTFQLYEPPP